MSMVLPARRKSQWISLTRNSPASGAGRCRGPERVGLACPGRCRSGSVPMAREIAVQVAPAMVEREVAVRGYVPVFVDNTATETDGTLFEEARRGYDGTRQYWLHGVFAGSLWASGRSEEHLLGELQQEHHRKPERQQRVPRVARTFRSPNWRPHRAAGCAMERPGAVMMNEEAGVPLVPHPQRRGAGRPRGRKPEVSGMSIFRYIWRRRCGRVRGRT